MNVKAYLYALVRFMPFSEAEEFANVGVVIIDLENARMEFKTERTKYRRYTEFFSGVNGTMYRHLMLNVENELGHTQHAIRGSAPEHAAQVFDFLTRPKEGIICYSRPRGIMGEEIIDTLEKLFKRFVDQDVSDAPRKEALLNKKIETFINSIAPKTFKEDKILHEDVFITLPFVQKVNGLAERAIKPLFLGQKNLNDVYTHGESWIGKIKRLRKVMDWTGDIYIPIETSKPTDKHFQAHKEIKRELQSLGNVIIEELEENQPFTSEKMIRWIRQGHRCPN